MYVYTYVCVFACVRVCVCLCVCVCVCVCVYSIYIHIYIYTHVYIYIQRIQILTALRARGWKEFVPAGQVEDGPLYFTVEVRAGSVSDTADNLTIIVRLELS
jgi:hypothetical protein